ncbi:NTP transferase domain-containing protein [Microbacterium sp. Bi128]|uniref:nucleotidyltransferase family protein n=1 Tax=Microbacterium sp. Bi128 TaxID=2821115 RepID=UPI001DF43BA7|nr:NTP transferase domain-containing protein [Microbacterium sp. Bi128]CAH0133319.1 Nicotine blue oxidoreductase [Microbacterium sp. Bi128]
MPAEPPSDAAETTREASPAGLVLAAGAGRRFGGPKALARDPDGIPWVEKAVRALRDGGCDPVVVVLGAGADEAAGLVPHGARMVRAAAWAEGVSASLRAGLEAVASTSAPAVVVVPVDTPELPAAAVARLARRARPGALAFATYAGAPGHPVLIGRAHWDALAAGVHGDVGARPYLRGHGAAAVDCGDLWSGADRDER